MVQAVPIQRAKKRLKSKSFDYDERYREKFHLTRTRVDFPDGTLGTVSKVQDCYVILCCDLKYHPLVILIDDVSRWYIDYRKDEINSAARNFKQIVDGLTKNHPSYEVADYYLMKDWYER